MKRLSKSPCVYNTTKVLTVAPLYTKRIIIYAKFGSFVQQWLNWLTEMCTNYFTNKLS